MRRSIVLAILVVLGGCSGGGDGGPATTTTAGTTAATTAVTSPTTAPPAPAELRFTFDGITGSQGMILVVTVFAVDGQPAATVCLPVDADPFSGMAVAASAAPDNPCGHDAPYGVPLTTEGAFSYLAATYIPGSQTAQACAFGDVTVAGPTEVVIVPADLTLDNCNA